MRPGLASTHLQHGYWARAVWLLRALPPGRPAGPVARTRRLWARKVAHHASAALYPPTEEIAAASHEVLPGVPAGLLLAWWADRSGTWRTPSSDTLLMRVGSAVLHVTGGVAAAHSLLIEYCAALADTNDEAFTEAAIRDASITARTAGSASP